MTRHTIEVDEATATLLRDRAAERGMSVSDLVAGLVARAEPPAELAAEEKAALDRQWAAIASGEASLSSMQFTFSVTAVTKTDLSCSASFMAGNNVIPETFRGREPFDASRIISP